MRTGLAVAVVPVLLCACGGTGSGGPTASATDAAQVSTAPGAGTGTSAPSGTLGSAAAVSPGASSGSGTTKANGSNGNKNGNGNGNGGNGNGRAGTVRIAAVGDMNPEKNTSTSSPSAKNSASIQAALASGEVSAFFGLGDFQYTSGTCQALVDGWGRLWAPVIPKMYTIAGPTHDTTSRPDELGYRRFFAGRCPGSTARSAADRLKGDLGPLDPYSVDLGAWHFAMMPTAALRYDDNAGTRLAAWLDADLTRAEQAGRFLAVAYHDPYFTSRTDEHDRETRVKPWVVVMAKHRVRLTLSGSQHNYERSCPVLADDTCTADSGPGMTAFQVSTGGITLRKFRSSPSYLVRRFDDTHGWLELRLAGDGSFSWTYHAVDGPGRDSGSRVRPAA